MQKTVANTKLKTCDIDVGNVPRHVAIILDGNGRWAGLRRQSRSHGHRKGAARVFEIVKAAGEFGIEALTLYAFSEENWQRPVIEVTALMNLLYEFLREWRQELRKHKVRIKVIGDMARLPKISRELLGDMLGDRERDYQMTLTLALSYSGRSEIVGACKEIVEQVLSGQVRQADITEGIVNNALQTDGLPDLDLLIRTGGELRISNFLLWQLAYAELYFTPVFWPDFGRQHLVAAIKAFQRRQRRFGQVAEVREIGKGAL